MLTLTCILEYNSKCKPQGETSFQPGIPLIPTLFWQELSFFLIMDKEMWAGLEQEVQIFAIKNGLFPGNNQAWFYKPSHIYPLLVGSPHYARASAR